MADMLPDDRGAELRRAFAERRAQMSAARARAVELWRPSEAEAEETQMCALVDCPRVH